MNGAESIATPTNTSSVPRIRRISTVDVPCENRPSTSSANPSAVRTAANGVRKRWKRPGGSSAPSRTAAIGGTRVARSAGKKLAISVTTIPSASETTIVRVSSRMPLFGQREPDRVEQREQALREAEPEEQPDDRCEDAHHERLEHDRHPHLTSRRAERPQRRELTRALRDRDRQRVDDHERADEERDQSEGEQEVAEERDELVRGLRVLARLGVAGPHLGVRRQDLADLLDELRGRDSRLRGGADLVELPLLAEEPLGRREVEAGERRAADRADRPELDEAGDPELLERALDLHADRLARPSGPSCRPSTVSTTTSFGPGQAPCTSVRLLNCGFVGSTENPRFGAPPNAIVLPSLTSCVLSLETPPIASWTSGSACTFGEQRLVERRLGRSVVARRRTPTSA